ncbi:type I restriction endonuclease subunit M [Mesorhizobium sp. B2-2-2]|uniref:HsdM family class I SAM-dependent methyltransferase n=1 Tax=Mesorhizobium sp. B2-2-2 TaxID=2589964 RepID=UPI00112EAD43|nr:class I SAM-dependent DNA methyltransferase [Mesorhizobium sp. B2-2-2]TPM27262.1 type I restriction endonuclease subunit M [Mesorhizobium sp. B2-2-2]
MAVKKSQIYSSLWKSCDALRGGMDASQYKDYILTLLFLKYVSDRSDSDPEAQIDVPEGCHFEDMLALKGSKDIGEEIDKIVEKIAETNGLGGVINNASFNDPAKLGDGKDMVERLSNLLEIFSRPELDFRKNRAEGDDILGDAYEYLMRHFATESGKSKGQFYTPSEVSRIMAKVVGINYRTPRTATIYDPTCGSGSLLLKAADAAPDGLSIYGQEKDVATFALARMNMVIHNNADADLWRGNVITQPHFKTSNGGLRTFDFVVANPPFSDKAWSTGLEQDFGRFVDGTPPAKNGDYAYLLHVIGSIKSTGKAVIVMPHGVLFRGNAEGEIRKRIIGRGYIKGIIGLPANLFYGTGIPACLIVLDKENAQARTGIFMMDASKGFVKDGPKNRLRHQDVHKIVDVFLRGTEIPGYSRMVSVTEIMSTENGGNLNLPRYIDSSEPEDLQDIEAHLKGGIPAADIDALDRFWKAMPALREALFQPHERSGYLSARHAPRDVRNSILQHPDFLALGQQLDQVFAEWRGVNIERMRDFGPGQHPKDLIHALSEDLLERFRAAPLIDGYDAYQHIMTFWSDVMQDDAYLIASDGWDAAKVIRELVKDKDGKLTEEPDIVLGSGRSARRLKAEIIPPALIVARFFAEEKTALDALEAELEDLEQRIAELDEEHGGEDGALAECRNEKGKVTTALLKARRKALAGEFDQGIFKRYDKLAKQDGAGAQIRIKLLETIPDFLEMFAIDDMLKLLDEESDKAASFKEARAKLDAKTVAKYPQLTDAEVKTLVVEDKWIAAIEATIRGERDRIAQGLTGRIATLVERYAETLPALSDRVIELEGKVAGHLKAMGFAW